MKRPMVPAAIFSLILSFLMLNCNAFFKTVLVVLCLALLIFCIVVKRFRNFTAIFAVSVVILSGAVYIQTEKINAINSLPQGEAFEVSGIVESENYNNGYAIYTVKTDKENRYLPSGIKISVYTKFAAFTVGDSINCNMYVTPVSEEYKSGNYSRGIYATATVKSVIKSSPTYNLNTFLYSFKQKASGKLFKYLSYDSAATVNALTLGDKYYVSSDFGDAVRRSGVSHIMVVSGMHMAVICGTFLKILRHMRLGKKFSSVITAVFVFMFMALCGFSMSVMRAGITYFIMLISLFFVRRTDALNSLCVSVCVIIMLNPFSAGSVAFILSVFSTAGIIVLSNPMANKIKAVLPLKSNIYSLVINSFSVTLSALIFTLPFTVYYFGAVSTVSVITNLLVGSVITVALCFSCVALPMAMLFNYSYIARILFSAVEYIMRYYIFVIEYFAKFPSAYIQVNKIIFLIWYLAIILTFGIIIYNKKIISVVKNCAHCIGANVKIQHKKR